jgi:hypothetical protein
MAFGMTTGLSSLISAITPLVASKADAKWTNLQKQAILRNSGLPQGSDWNHLGRQPIWNVYASEGRTVDAVQRVLASRFIINTTDPDLDDVVPIFSKEVASDIKAACFALVALTGETCDRGFLPIALQPRFIQDTQAEEECRDIESQRTFTMSGDIETRRSKSARYSRAPAGYAGLSNMLKAFVRAWIPHFGHNCPMVVQTNVLRSTLVQRKASYEQWLTPHLSASITWMFSQQVHAYLTTPYNASGEAPTPNLYLLLAKLRSETIQQPLSLPKSVVAN